MKRRLIALAGLALAAFVVYVACRIQTFRMGPSAGGGDAVPEMRTERDGTGRRPPDAPKAYSAKAEPTEVATPSQEAGDSSESDGDRREVDAFDALVDGWMEARPAGVSIEDVEDFRKAFAHVPDESRDECLHRALNLIPDENALLLAGVLLDKSFGKDVLEAVFNDILNRDDSAKLPILKNLYKDRTHPCWADAAWILDVTGEAEHKPTD